MLFNCLLTNRTILLRFFFLLLDVFKRFFTTLVQIENVRLRLALVIHSSATMTVTNDTIEILPVVTDKTINYLSK